MELGSPSRMGQRRRMDTPEKGRPLPAPPTPLSERRWENRDELPESSTAPQLVRTAGMTPVRVTPFSPHTGRSSPRPLPSVEQGRPLPSPQSMHAIRAGRESPLARRVPPRPVTPQAPVPVIARAPSPLKGGRPMPSDDVFSDSPRRPVTPVGERPTTPVSERPVSPRGARPPATPPRTPPPPSRTPEPRPTTPLESLHPDRPETPTRCRTPEANIPRIARTPSPVRSMRPYPMTPAIPGGPPVPMIMIDGEVMTDAMMDPSEAHDATVSFDDISVPHAQRASHTSAADRAGVRVSAGIHQTCHGCDKWIGGAMVHAMNHAWHARCFVCAQCTTPLEHVSFYEHDGRPYCHLDFHELFARRCFHCQTPIVEERFVTIDDAQLGERSYHELHFFCASCGDPFLDPKDLPSPKPDASVDTDEGYAGKPFFVQGAHPYCEKCHTRLHKPKCKACRLPIEHDVVRALRADWHPDCFVCTRCRAPLHDAPVFQGPDGAPCDLDCYQAWMRRAN